MADPYRADSNWGKIQDLFFDKVLNRSNSLKAISGPAAARVDKMRIEQSRIDYQDALFDASRSMIRFRKPSRLIRVIDKIIKEKAGVSAASVLIFDRSINSYVLADSTGDKDKKMPSGFLRLDSKSALVELFRNKKSISFFENGIVNVRELEWILESGQLIRKDVYLHNRLRAVQSEMELLSAEMVVPCFFKNELLGLLLLGEKLSGRNFTRQEVSLFATLANDAAMALANARLIEGLRKKVDEVGHLYEREHRLFMSTAVALAKAVEARDLYMQGHTERVTRYCMLISDKIAQKIQADADKNFKQTLYITALLHDIGKIGIPDRILNKRGKLSPSDRRIVERHPEIGASILYPIKELGDVARYVRSHQEWFNGNGYPDGLKKEEIPVISRVISVADAFDAITSDRPYRKRRGTQEAIEEIKECAGTQFDPAISELFIDAFNNGNISL